MGRNYIEGVIRFVSIANITPLFVPEIMFWTSPKQDRESSKLVMLSAWKERRGVGWGEGRCTFRTYLYVKSILWTWQWSGNENKVCIRVKLLSSTYYLHEFHSFHRARKLLHDISTNAAVSAHKVHTWSIPGAAQIFIGECPNWGHICSQWVHVLLIWGKFVLEWIQFGCQWWQMDPHASNWGTMVPNKISLNGVCVYMKLWYIIG